MLKNDREFTGTLLGFDDFVSEFVSFQNPFAFSEGILTTCFSFNSTLKRLKWLNG